MTVQETTGKSHGATIEETAQSMAAGDRGDHGQRAQSHAEKRELNIVTGVVQPPNLSTGGKIARGM